MKQHQYLQQIKFLDMNEKRLLIIGAGPSGLSLLRAFEIDRQNIKNFPQIICCQKQVQWGGQWNYFTKAKVDQNGIPIPSTNQYLWTNAPKQCYQYPDYSFDDHFCGRQMPSYLPRQYLKQYFTSRFQKVDIKKYIKFETIAKNVQFDAKKQKFFAEIQNLKTNISKIQQFDYVVIATGHYSVPNIPQFQGLQQFQGNLLHSIQIKDYKDYQGDNVLVIGTGLSAEDAVLQCYKYKANSIKVSYRTKPMTQNIPSQIEQLPLIKNVKEKTVTFINGQQRIFDTIIMCTGYKHNFVFLDQKLRLQANNKLWSQSLYKGVIWQQIPQLMYLGMQAQYFSFMMFDIQSHVAKAAITGQIQLPSKEQMKKDGLYRQQLVNKIKNPFQEILYMGDYLQDLIHMCQYPNYKLNDVVELYILLQRHKEQNVLTFRDNIYQSTVSKKWSIRNSQTWIQAGSKFQNQILNQETQEYQDFLKIDSASTLQQNIQVELLNLSIA